VAGGVYWSAVAVGGYFMKCLQGFLLYLPFNLFQNNGAGGGFAFFSTLQSKARVNWVMDFCPSVSILVLPACLAKMIVYV
jgi:hypothetical protein